MIKRMIYIDNPYFISSKNEQIVFNSKDTGDIKEVPAEDLGFLVLDNYQITFTMNAINKIGEYGGILITCGKNHHPSIVALPLEGNHLQTERLRNQINATAPMLKSLWGQIIKAKIRNQAFVLKHFGFDDKYLISLAENVKSGDSTHREAIASKHYWKTLFEGTVFKRDPEGDYPNNFLNYGYAIVRAATARAIVTAGMHPSIGIHHKNKLNTFCLADDLMEPYRPVVDKAVYSFYRDYPDYPILDKESKKFLLNSIYLDVKIKDKTHPLMIGINETCSSLNDYYSGKIKKIKLPELCD